MNRHTLKVGITGGIGSGKSTAARIFALLGIPIYSADDRAKWLMANDPDLRKSITKLFGNEAFLPNGVLDRSFLAKEVFSDPEQVKRINSIVHPAVKKDFESWVSQLDAPYALKEAALIFETGGENQLDVVINVSAPLKIRIDRVLSRDSHRSESQVNQIIDQQLSDEIKNEKADYVIKNSPNKLIIPQVLTIHDKLIKQAAKT